MKKFGIIPFIIFIFIHTFTVQAQITLDGTCGVSGVLEGPDFKIEAGMGKEYGNNLFHSFGKFNINTGETAIFYGPESVTNIITRVTGGSQSWIDGSLKSDIAGANLFLLNPSGIMFGPNASLDISGSFHMNTAEYLRFEDGVKFDAVYPQNNLLTLAAPTAFGFLKENPAHIAVKGDIKVQQCKAISLTAGNIDITGGTLEAQNGQINITSTGETAANGNIIINKGSVFADGGQISISGTSSGKEIPLAYADNMAFEGYG
ncbi:MAG: filamentous hemagglutinin N-terminal domain-containing protein, partial [Desulfobacteraceae bacterium]|nr:filamentous hemagglutinin N-terminal domain-containing protein [Desulfobacteraceae bacterium]